MVQFHLLAYALLVQSVDTPVLETGSSGFESLVTHLIGSQALTVKHLPLKQENGDRYPGVPLRSVSLMVKAFA